MLVDVNTATESDLIGIPPLDSDAAAQIIEHRKRRRFSDWTPGALPDAAAAAAAASLRAKLRSLKR